MSGDPGYYTAYGLSIRSEVALPCRPTSPAAEPDVTIRFGTPPPMLDASADRHGLWQSMPGRSLLNVPGVARFLVTGGREIVVESGRGSLPAARAFLLGPVLAACLQQRGIVTLHASAIATDAGAVLFAGDSGSGKSTLLASFLKRGYPMLADDVTGVVLDAKGCPLALSAFPRLRLWADALDRIAWQARARERVRDELEKYIVPTERFRAAPLRLGAIFTLTTHNRGTLEIDSTEPASALRELFRYTYRWKLVRGLRGQAQHFRTVGALARQVPLMCVRRPQHPFLLDELADAIEQHLSNRRPPDVDDRSPLGQASAPAEATAVN